MVEYLSSDVDIFRIRYYTWAKTPVTPGIWPCWNRGKIVDWLHNWSQMSWTIVRAKSVSSSCSKPLSWDFKSQRDPTWSYHQSCHQCFMIAAPIVHGRRPLIEEVTQLVVPPIGRLPTIGHTFHLLQLLVIARLHLPPIAASDCKLRSWEASPIVHSNSRDSLWLVELLIVWLLNTQSRTNTRDWWYNCSKWGFGVIYRKGL